MIPYLVVFAILVLFSMLSITTTFRRFAPYFFWTGVILIILFAGLREPGVGTDDRNYTRMIAAVGDLGDWIEGRWVYNLVEISTEPGFIALISIAKLVSYDFRWVLFVITFVSVVSCSIAYRHLTPHFMFCLPLYFSHTFLGRDMNHLRAGVAASLGLFVIPLIRQKRHVFAAALIGLCMTFHMGATGFFILYCLTFINWTPLRVLGALALSFVLGAVGIAPILVAIIPKAGYFVTKLMHYQGTQVAEAISLLDITNIKNVGVLLLAVWFWRPGEAKIPYFKEIVIFLMAAACWRIALADFGIVAGRIATFFSIAEVLILANIISLFKRPTLVAGSVLGYGALMLVLNLFKGAAVQAYRLGF